MCHRLHPFDSHRRYFQNTNRCRGCRRFAASYSATYCYRPNDLEERSKPATERWWRARRRKFVDLSGGDSKPRQLKSKLRPKGLGSVSRRRRAKHRQYKKPAASCRSYLESKTRQLSPKKRPATRAKLLPFAKICRKRRQNIRGLRCSINQRLNLQALSTESSAVNPKT